jgi:16S rRNA (cytosine1402-N4)-methyltransferase
LWSGLERVTGPWGHEPVLVEEALTYWVTDPRGLYLDGTVGAGGHAEALLLRFSEARVIGLDRDRAALEIARTRLGPFGSRVRLEQADFADIEDVLGRLGGAPAGILLDLGISSVQLDDPHRGFSYLQNAPLKMTLDRDASSGAREFLADIEEGRLAEMLREYGELPRAGRIAREIVAARTAGRLDTTQDLVTALRRAGLSHPRRLSQVFQALRFAVNSELESLDRGLVTAARVLPPSARLVVIAFESLTDRRVKQALRPVQRGRPHPGMPEPRPQWTVLTSKAIRPRSEEIARNPRARSARLRAAERTSNA